MPNINAVVNQQISRLAKRVVNVSTQSTRRLVTQHRRDLAAVKRQMAMVLKTLAFLEKQEKKRTAQLPLPEKVDDIRFRADGLKTHRAKLGLSADNYGKLVGVSGLTIYHWEARKSKPRTMQLPKIAAVRGIGKREALQRLGLAPTTTAPAQPTGQRSRKRGTFKRTAEEMILSLLKGRRSLATRQINAAWKKEGRAGTADVTLGRMVKARALKRIKVKGQRGSTYQST